MSEQPIKRGRGRPPLTEEQKRERDLARQAKQAAYYEQNKDRITERQKKTKLNRYQTDPLFRQRAIEYISMYNKRRTAICNFVESWPDKAFQDALAQHLVPYPHPTPSV